MRNKIKTNTKTDTKTNTIVIKYYSIIRDLMTF